MNINLFTKTLLFAAGAGIGSLVTWKIVSAKYERIIQEEVDSVKEIFSKRDKENLVNESREDVDYTEELISDEESEKYNDIIDENNYNMDETEEDDDMNAPYVIEPEELWESDYPTITLTYYEGNKILADDKDRIIKNVAELVGADFASHFGEYEDDSVYVRNDNVKAIYEILKDHGCYETR